ncbi:DUF4235 domain-containing protein [Hamadaea tsunoensis]|uniref:DUF4235 domain-containing protein n=1 Tax=Hamadaea tsunoensis TaxID=53368 RepID=UPI00040964D5|nr:DUF4235 domain-containing protein [Hamadaea tsunoensis]
MNGSKLLYRPVGLVGGLVAGAMAGWAFKRLWRTLSDEDDTPDAIDRDRGWTEILIAATIEGAIFGVVRAAVDRASATGVSRLTGRWPD